MRPNPWKLAVIAPLAILAMVLFVFIGGELVLHLWNWLLPPLFGFPEITFWQALGILLLCRILFGGFGWRGSSRDGVRARVRARVVDRVADRIGDRWDAMTPEERERFRARVRERCGFDPAGGGGPRTE
jgi:hypothetical protein